VKRYPKPGHCAGLVQISPGQFSPGPEKVGIGPIPVQQLLGLDWTGLGRTRSELVQCWTGGIIAPDTSPARLLVSPASATLISLTIGDSPIVQIIELPPSGVDVVAGSLVVASRQSGARYPVAVPGLPSTRGAGSSVQWSFRR